MLSQHIGIGLRDVTSFGGIFFYVVTMPFFLFFGNSEFFFRLLVGLVGIYLVAVIIRAFYFKERRKKVEHHSITDGIGASSFPDVHSVRTVVLALTLIEYVNGTPISLMISILALLVFYSRVYLRKQEYVDVIGGMFFGVRAGGSLYLWEGVS